MSELKPLIIKDLTTNEHAIGKGFSIAEIKEVGLSVTKAKKLGLKIDLRRRTKHEQNVETLKKWVGVPADDKAKSTKKKTEKSSKKSKKKSSKKKKSTKAKAK